MATASAPIEPRVYPDLHSQSGYRDSIDDAPAADPEVPTVDCLAGTQDFRLNRISRIEAELRQERDARQKLYKKYSRAITTIDTVTTVSSSVTVATGAGGIALIATGVGAPAGAALEGLAVAGGVVSIVGRLVNRRLTRKARKHDRIAQAASAILATVGEITSRALTDSRISHDEFQQVQDQMRRFNERKRAIRDEPSIKKQESARRDLDKLLRRSSQRFEREKEAAVASAMADSSERVERARSEGEAQALKKIATSLAGGSS